MGTWATITIAYREKDFIRGALENRVSYDENVVMVSEKPFFGEAREDDGTVDIAEEMGATVVTGIWTQDDPMVNCGMELLKDYDWVVFLAPDEFLTQEDHQKLKDFVESDGRHKAYAVQTMNTYFKAHNQRVEPREPYKPIIVLSGDNRLRDIRSVNTSFGFLPEDITLHHFSYFRTDEKMKEKLECFCHAPQILEGWYERVWMGWNPQMRDFHPTHPQQYKGIVIDEPPREITHHLRHHSLLNA